MKNRGFTLLLIVLAIAGAIGFIILIAGNSSLPQHYLEVDGTVIAKGTRYDSSKKSDDHYIVARVGGEDYGLKVPFTLYYDTKVGGTVTTCWSIREIKKKEDTYSYKAVH